MKRIQNEQWLDALPEEAVKVAEEVNIDIARVIAERIKNIGELKSSDIKKLTNAVEFLGADMNKITKLIEKHSKSGKKAVEDALEQAADSSDEFARLFYVAKGIAPRSRHNDVYLHRLVDAIIKQTGAQFTNLSQTLAFRINDRTLSLRQMYTRAIDKAIYEVQSGTLDYHTAMRKTVRELAESLRTQSSRLVIDEETGEVKLHWESGHSRRLDSHVRQNVIDGVKQLQSQMLDYHGDRFGADGVELSAHAICAPDHLAVQGRQFSNDEFEKMQRGFGFEDVNGNQYNGFARPIGQWNCRHVKFPIIIGISQPAHTEEQLEQYAQNSRDKYDLTQKQRAMETKLRSLKNQRLAASAAGDELEAKRIQHKINVQQTIYRRFSEKYDLLYDTRRASVEGYRRIAVDKSAYMKGNLPKNYIDERTVGKLITREKLNEVMEFAKKNGVRIGSPSDMYGGFEYYRGDIKILKDLIEELSTQQNSELFIGCGSKNPILWYGYVRDDSDLSKIDVNAFAQTNGRNITLNKFMFDDSKYLLSEYSKAEQSGHFVRGSNHKSIISHEVGHIINKNRRSLYTQSVACIENHSKIIGISLKDYIRNNISMYAAYQNSDLIYTELISEINSLLQCNKNSDIIKLLKQGGVL